MHMSADMGIDFSFQKDNMYRRMRRLICFDMDSTLIQTECIDELADRAGVGDKVRAITESAMRGEIDFKESFTRRVALLKGLDASVMQEIAEKMPITEGADRLMSVLKRCGYKIAILSGGFTYFGEYLQRRYGIDYVYANELEIDDNNKLTGRYVGEIVDGTRKAELLKLMAERTDMKYISDIKPDADEDFAKFEGRYYATPKKMGAQTAEANINAGIAAAGQINSFFEKGDTKYQVNK